jgi:hypothetical protein
MLYAQPQRRYPRIDNILQQIYVRIATRIYKYCACKVKHTFLGRVISKKKKNQDFKPLIDLRDLDCNSYEKYHYTLYKTISYDILRLVTGSYAAPTSLIDPLWWGLPSLCRFSRLSATDLRLLGRRMLHLISCAPRFSSRTHVSHQRPSSLYLFSHLKDSFLGWLGEAWLSAWLLDIAIYELSNDLTLSHNAMLPTAHFHLT